MNESLINNCVQIFFCLFVCPLIHFDRLAVAADENACIALHDAFLKLEKPPLAYLSFHIFIYISIYLLYF